ncbi:uncharacterized protein LOC114434809 isoform X2 [Parambassis ranga]|nr:uncharacterized protein LOC114434809 isoform X2 [Parambassis ranga]
MNEIEYYLQQSQLSHYPERKIAEFQLHIETLEKEYKRFITKLRVLDPSCTHKPWTPRAYCKRRADTQDSSGMVKIARHSESQDGSSQNRSQTSCYKTSTTEGALDFSENLLPTNTVSETSEVVCAAQDQPLSFDHTRLAVAAAAFRGPSVLLTSSSTQSLARVLQAGLPNLNNYTRKQTSSLQVHDKDDNARALKHPAVEQKGTVEETVSETIEEKSIEKRSSHVLGLECYSSSDEDSDT